MGGLPSPALSGVVSVYGLLSQNSRQLFQRCWLFATQEDGSIHIADDGIGIIFVNCLELAAVLGKETIDTYNTGESRGRETSHSLNYQKLGKELMSQDELAVMDGGKCILQLRGVRPFLSDKYDITRHPNFKYTADADKRNTFDIEAFLSARLKLKPDEVCDVYEVDTEGV